MSQSGWIKLHREITDHWVWDCEFSTAQAWIDLLVNACHKPNKLMIKGQLIELKRGQQARSEVTLSRDWKWSRGRVRRFLNQCENDGMIECKSTHLTSIITICNYDSFQSCGTADGTANDTADGTANGQLTVHKQEVKNVISKETQGVARDVKSKNNDIDYQAIADAYNEALGDKLPACKALNEKRKRAIKKLLAELSEPTADAAARYFSSFAKRARPFHFGENDRGWKADFDFVVRSETLLKTREGAL